MFDMTIWRCSWHLYVTSLMTCCSACTTTQFNEYKNVSINNVKYEVIITWTTYQVTISPCNWIDCVKTTSVSLIIKTWYRLHSRRNWIIKPAGVSLNSSNKEINAKYFLLMCAYFAQLRRTCLTVRRVFQHIGLNSPLNKYPFVKWAWPILALHKTTSSLRLSIGVKDRLMIGCTSNNLLVTLMSHSPFKMSSR